VLERDAIPPRVLEAFGEPGREWIASMTMNTIEASAREGELTMDEDKLEQFHALRAFMFQHVYLREDAETQRDKAIRLIQQLVDYFSEHPEEIPVGYALDGDHPLQQAVDYVSGMSDSYALKEHDRLFRPKGLY
jgi:dGTPase